MLFLGVTPQIIQAASIVGGAHPSSPEHFVCAHAMRSNTYVSKLIHDAGDSSSSGFALGSLVKYPRNLGRIDIARCWTVLQWIAGRGLRLKIASQFQP